MARTGLALVVVIAFSAILAVLLTDDLEPEAPHVPEEDAGRPPAGHEVVPSGPGPIARSGAVPGEPAGAGTDDRRLSIGGTVLGPAAARPETIRLTVRRKGGRPGPRWPGVLDASRRFTVAGLAPGAYEVTASLEWGDRRWLGRVDAHAGDRDVVVQLEETETRGTTLRVRIVGASGEPVPVGKVTLRGVGASGTVSSTRPFKDGRADIDLTGDPDMTGLRLWLIASDAPGGLLGTAVVGPFDARRELVEVRLDPARGIRGRVTGANDRPVAGVVVQAGLLLAGEVWGTHGSATTDESGSFEIGGLGDLIYRLVVPEPGELGVVEPVDVKGGESGVVIRLIPGEGATLRVVTGEDDPVPGARVTILGFTPGHGGARHVLSRDLTADPEGCVAVRGLKPGLAFELRVRPPEGREDLREARTPGWDPEDATIVLMPAFRLSGRVEGAAGEPQAGMVVRYQRVDDDDVRWRSTRTESDGSFTITGIEDGEYWIWPATGSRDGSDPARARVRAGASEILLRTDAGSSLTVRLGGWNRGVPCVVGLRGQDGGEKERPAIDGEAVFHGVDAGRPYAVYARETGGSRFAYREYLTPGPETVEIPLVKGGAISGRILMASGGAPRHASAEILVHGFSVRVAASQGEFRVTGVPPGRYAIRVSALDAGGQTLMGSAEASPGEPVEIRVRAE